MVYQFHDLQLDIGRRQLSRNGDPIKLTKLNFNLLQALVEAAPDLLSTDELIDKVWGPGRVISPENVTQRIMMVRQSLGDDANNPVYIEGIRGQGIRLLPEVELISGQDQVADAVEQSSNKEGTLASRTGLISLLVLLVAVALWLFSPDDGYSRRTDQPLRPGSSSIAVLPFANLSPNPDNSFYAAGIHEEVLNHLAKLTGLRVISRTSMLRYENTRRSIPAIAKELEVDTVIEGSVRYANNRIRVTVQLVDGPRDEHLWSETYDRELQDIFSIESDIARDVAGVLQKLVTTEQAAVLGVPPTNNLRAHAHYMQGRQALLQRKPQELEEAVTHFRAAIELDDNYALAWVGLADALQLRDDYAYRDRDKSLVERKKAVRKALELDASLGEAWLAQATLSRQEGDYENAEQQYLRAITLNPNYAQSYHWYGLFLQRSVQRPEEALVQVRKAVELDPMGQASNAALVGLLWDLGRAEESIALSRKLIKRDPHVGYYHWNLSYHLAQLGALDSSLYWARAGLVLEPHSLRGRTRECKGLLLLGDDVSAEQCQKRLDSDFPEHNQYELSRDILLFRGQQDIYLEQVSSRAAAADPAGSRQGELAWAYFITGKYDEARAIYENLMPEYYTDEAVVVLPTTLFSAISSGIILSHSSQPNLARAEFLFDAALETIDSMHRSRGGNFGVADLLIYVAKDDRAKAYTALRQSIDSGWRLSWSNLRRPLFDQISQEPAWRALYDELEADVNRQYENYKAHKDNPEYWQ